MDCNLRISLQSANVFIEQATFIKNSLFKHVQLNNIFKVKTFHDPQDIPNCFNTHFIETAKYLLHKAKELSEILGYHDTTYHSF